MTRIEDVGGGPSGRPRRGKRAKHSQYSRGSGKSRSSGGGRSSASGGTKRERSTTASGASGTSASIWPHAAPHVGSAGTPAMELVAQATGADAGLLDALLELLGTEHLTLGHALAVWQREQDRLANRAWRRPGGLARPAGL